MNNYEKTQENLNLICLECESYETKDCVKSKCNIGFSINAIKASNPNTIQIINDGEKLIPKTDMKLYNKDLIAKGIASVCKICMECNKGHDDNCTISLARKSLERTYLSVDVVYPGSVLMYLFNVAKQDEDLSNKIKFEYDSMDTESKQEVIMDKSSISKMNPISVDLKENETYFWCTCGKSSSSPFCNGAHVGTNFIPLAFTAKKTQKTHLCACNHTKNPPFCDGSHLKLV
ncbi:CDGSH iron-sulfur domain-containing protein [Clostridium sp. AL.422]|uniref:CDGSH iron-sulfur domain-containing protein n=1 Tax=Clostridium TaxID=1485 RepID=UPI00293DBD16|nr:MULTISPECIES: CDGSH iron-sulfur domain-containing protein [unclassified Clostridium]MDV4150234.1 CDGSH iron-sulfur domain-containing protein [Clostridium sp. AL.422]